MWRVEEIGMLQRRGATFPARAPPRTGTGNCSCRIPRHSILFHSPICGRYDTNEVSSTIGISIGHVVVGTDIDQRERAGETTWSRVACRWKYTTRSPVHMHTQLRVLTVSRTSLGGAPLGMSVCIPAKPCGACCGVFDARHGSSRSAVNNEGSTCPK